ncbi:hypothetical protein ACP4OV_011210 [Aristida adscensionis]
MGKYMRKGKVSGEVAVVEVAAAPLGVRTRARALAMQRLQKQQQQPQGEGEGEGKGTGKGGAGADYLELRSRRLEKLPPPTPAARRSGGRKAASAAAAAREEEAFFGENVLESDAMDREYQGNNALQLDKGLGNDEHPWIHNKTQQLKLETHGASSREPKHPKISRDG